MQLAHSSNKGAFGLQLESQSGGANAEMIDEPMLKQASFS